MQRRCSRAWAWSSGLRRRRMRGDLIDRFDVRGTDAQGVQTPTRALSGGNMQKLILGRALVGDPGVDQPPTLIVADQPTWGLDIGAVAYVHQQLLDACAQGAAVLLICEDLEEIFAIADRVAVLHEGHLSEARPAADWTLAEIGLAMSGAAGGRRVGRRCGIETCRRASPCALKSARCHRGACSWPHRCWPSPSRCWSARCSSPGPARRWAAPTRCCWKAASAPPSPGARR